MTAYFDRLPSERAWRFARDVAARRDGLQRALVAAVALLAAAPVDLGRRQRRPKILRFVQSIITSFIVAYFPSLIAIRGPQLNVNSKAEWLRLSQNELIKVGARHLYPRLPEALRLFGDDDDDNADYGDDYGNAAKLKDVENDVDFRPPSEDFQQPSDVRRPC